MKKYSTRVQLAELLSSEKYSIVAINETWLDDTITDAILVSHPCNSKKFAYSVFRKDRNARGGGVCLLIHNNFSSSPVLLSVRFSELEVVSVDISVNESDKHRVVCVYYPHRDVSTAKPLADCISDLCNVPYTVTVLGDFNLPHIDWNTFMCPQDGVHNVLLDSFLSNSLTQLVDSVTRKSSLTQPVDVSMEDEGNILDLVLSTDENSIADVRVSDVPFPSDHYSVSFSVQAEVSRSDPRFVKEWKKADYNGISAFLSVLNWNELFASCKDPEDFYNVFLSVMKMCVDGYVPVRRMRRGFAFRLPRKLRRLRARKKLLWKNRNSTVDGRRKFQECRREFDRKVKIHAEKLENKCVNSGNIKHFYDFANSKLKSKQGVAPLKRSDGSVSRDNSEKVEILNSFFCSVFTEDDGRKPEFETRVREDVKLENISFTPEKVCKVLKSLPNKTSRSPDNLPAFFLKSIAKNHTCSDVNCACLCEPLSRIFTVSFYFGVLPNLWLTADVVPLFKKGSVSDAGNYRPVSLTCVCCKIMETVVKNELLVYLLHNDLITRAQHGFLARKSVSTQLLESVNDWTLSAMHRKPVDVIYIDFQKAFDSVSHVKLIQKLVAYGITGYLLCWIKAFLSGRVQRVVIDSFMSTYKNVVSGVPQGSVLGPILFLLYINDLTDLVFDCSVGVKIFADDVKIYSEVESYAEYRFLFDVLPYSVNSSKHDLYSVLKNVGEWSTLWQLPIAAKKSAVLHFGAKNPRLSYDLNCRELGNVKEFRDLGVIMSSDLKFSQHCNIIAAKAMQRLGILFRAFKTKNWKTLVKAYTTYVRPLLENSTVVWSPHFVQDIECIERVQHNFTWRVFKRCFTERCSNGRHPDYEERCKTLGLQSLELRRLQFDLVMCYRILHGTVNLDEKEFFVRCTRGLRGHSLKLYHVHSSIDVRKYFFQRSCCWCLE